MPTEFALLIALGVLLLTSASALTWTVIAVQRGAFEPRQSLSSLGARRKARTPSPSDVAVLIAAHNEELGIQRTVDSAHEQVPRGNVFVASDGSTDATSRIARDAGAEVLEVSPNRGKAGALSHAITTLGLADRFEVVMLLDADTVLDANYLDTALPLLADDSVVAVAGTARTSWTPRPSTALGELLVTYRDRMYVVMQYLMKFGMASRFVNVVPIVPGFASLYRSRVLEHIDIVADGLVIEDFNMTFEVHAKRLGRIAFDPRAALAYTQDPDTWSSYVKQVRRWNLGFWQTLRRHTKLPPRFAAFLTVYVADVTLSALVTLLVPILCAASLLVGLPSVIAAESWEDIANIFPAWFIIGGYFAVDFAVTAVAFGIARRWEFLKWLPLLPLLRWVDAAVCLQAALLSLSSNNDGRWASPTRR